MSSLASCPVLGVNILLCRFPGVIGVKDQTIKGPCYVPNTLKEIHLLVCSSLAFSVWFSCSTGDILSQILETEHTTATFSRKFFCVPPSTRTSAQTFHNVTAVSRREARVPDRAPGRGCGGSGIRAPARKGLRHEPRTQRRRKRVYALSAPRFSHPLLGPHANGASQQILRLSGDKLERPAESYEAAHWSTLLPARCSDVLTQENRPMGFAVI